MSVRLLTDSAADRERYDQWIRNHPQRNLWQSAEYAAFQKARPLEIKIYIEEIAEQIVASALVIVHRTTFGLSTWNIPRGPLWTDQNPPDQLLETIRNDAKKDKCISLYISPVQNLKPKSYNLKLANGTNKPMRLF